MKYESENENDLKDKIDFMKPTPDHYPKHGKNFIKYIQCLMSFIL